LDSINGTVEVISRLGEGALFRIKIPPAMAAIPVKTKL
jgi:chemotaxis protein histidine kinase CheA